MDSDIDDVNIFSGVLWCNFTVVLHKRVL